MSHFVSGKLCPKCNEQDALLRWSYNESPPTVHFNDYTGRVSSVSLMRYCQSCGYREVGTVEVNKDPVWTEQKED